LFVARINDPDDHLLAALSCLRLGYLLHLVKELGIKAKIEYDIDRRDLTAFGILIEANPEEIAKLIEAAYDAGLGNFDVELEDVDQEDEATFDWIRQLDVARIYIA